MASTIILKRKTTTGAPSLASLAIGEVCLVLPDNAIYWKKDGATIVGPYLVSGSPSWGVLTGTLSNQTDLQSALDAKAPTDNPTFTGTVAGVTKAHVGLTNVDNTSDANKPVSTAQQTALNLKSNVDSPTFTGTPTAPTAATSTNTTQVATTEFVQAVVAALVNAAPGTLNTLQELATALGNDPNFASTITTALAGKIGVNDTIDGGTIS